MYKVEFYRQGQSRPFATLDLPDISGIVPGQFVDFPPLKTGPMHVIQMMTTFFPQGVLNTKVILGPNVKSAQAGDDFIVWPFGESGDDNPVPWPNG